MKLWMGALLVFAVCGSPQAAAKVWQPPGGHTQIPIWPDTPPGAHSVPGPETVTTGKGLTAGRHVHEVTNVTRPTMTVYSPKGENTDAAIVVFPGGGFQMLAIDIGGTEICQWATSIGITCALLKYRVPSVPFNWKCQCYDHGYDAEPIWALQDAQRTIRLLRAHAAKWDIDPHRIGVIGFSAGGLLVAEVSSSFNQQTYKPVDAVDKVSPRPDFALAIYPGHMITHEYLEDHDGIPQGQPNPNIHFTKQTPPTFLVQAEDDNVDSVNSSLAYFSELQKAGVPAELHIYAKGGHGFGLRRTKHPITAWPRLAETWLHTIGIIKEGQL